MRWIRFNIIAPLFYSRWIKMRDRSEDECGDKLCYCGHTYKCSCGDPDIVLFKESVRNGTVDVLDTENGWKDNEF